MKLLIILYHFKQYRQIIGDIRSDIAYLRGEIDKDTDDEATGV